jgi:valyl-tRNA synthetase
VVETLAKLNHAFDELRYDEMADAIYHFVWGTFCDWYVELVKPLLSPLPLAGGEEARSAEGVGASGEAHPQPLPQAGGEETRKVAAWAFDQILVMLHPLMPFITEELWHAMGERPYELIVAKWPEPQAQVDPHAKAEMDWLIGLVSSIRSGRTEVNVPPGEKLILSAPQVPSTIGDRIRRHYDSLRRLARLEMVSGDPPFAHGNLVVVHEDTTYYLPLEGIIDVNAEKARLDKAAAAAEKERDSLAQRLSNPNFTERAKPEAVEKARADHEAKAAEAERLRAALERLG